MARTSFTLNRRRGFTLASVPRLGLLWLLLCTSATAQEAPTAQEPAWEDNSFVLEATALGLDTCWVAGLFRPDVAARLAGVQPQERVLAVVPVGRAQQDWSFEERLMTGFGRVHKRKPLTELVKETREDQLPDWARTAVEAARLAPSAVNRQPWRFRFATETITVSEDNAKLTHAISKRLDCGIAMLHVEAGAMHAGVSGRWEFLQSPDVGRFVRIQ